MRRSSSGTRGGAWAEDEGRGAGAEAKLGQRLTEGRLNSAGDGAGKGGRLSSGRGRVRVKADDGGGGAGGQAELGGRACPALREQAWPSAPPGRDNRGRERGRLGRHIAATPWDHEEERTVVTGERWGWIIVHSDGMFSFKKTVGSSHKIMKSFFTKG